MTEVQPALYEIREVIMRNDWEKLARIEAAEPFNNIIGQIIELEHLLKAMIELSK